MRRRQRAPLPGQEEGRRRRASAAVEVAEVAECPCCWSEVSEARNLTCCGAVVCSGCLQTWLELAAGSVRETCPQCHAVLGAEHTDIILRGQSKRQILLKELRRQSACFAARHRPLQLSELLTALWLWLWTKSVALCSLELNFSSMVPNHLATFAKAPVRSVIGPFPKMAAVRT